MSIIPIITFKAGQCDVDQTQRPYKVTAVDKPGYIYLYMEDELIHFCWRPRDVPMTQPELDLVMVPTDGHFVPYDSKAHGGQRHAKTNGRIFVLKFGSSSQRHLFWLQSKPQGRRGAPDWFSPRDRKIGEIVDRLLQGEEVEVARELAQVRNNNDDSRGDGDDDEPMEDVEGHGGANDARDETLGGAGPGATGGDIREEGEDAREGGGDGARAASAGATDAAAMVQNLLNSLKGTPGLGAAPQAEGKLYPLLSDLLDSSTTVDMADSLSESMIDTLLKLLPPAVVLLSQRADSSSDVGRDPTPDDAVAALAAMNIDRKRGLLKRVLWSPQFHQSLTSLTLALRDGGLPTVSEALGIQVANGGRIKGSAVPLGGGEAVEAFVEGVKKSVQQKKQD